MFTVISSHSQKPLQKNHRCGEEGNISGQTAERDALRFTSLLWYRFPECMEY